MIAAAIIPLSAGSEPQAIALASNARDPGGPDLLHGRPGQAGLRGRPAFPAGARGYMAGLAITIVVGQLPKLFGFSVDASGLFNELVAFWQNLDSTNVWALAIGLVNMVLILALKRRKSRIPGVLAAVIVSILAVSLFDLTAQGVNVVGSLPQGFPRPALPAFDWAALPILLATAMGMSLVAIGIRFPLRLDSPPGAAIP